MAHSTNAQSHPQQDRRMALRIAGVVLPETKPVGTALTYLYGVGHSLAIRVLKQLGISPQVRVKDLTADEGDKIRRGIEQFSLENQLRQEVLTNIRRLKEISSYRGTRHGRNLPVRGQRTRTNARTKRGRRVTVGSGRKKVSEKT